MNEDQNDMIVPTGDAPVDNAPQKTNDSNAPEPTGEVSGVLLDNDEVQDEDGSGAGSDDGSGPGEPTPTDGSGGAGAGGAEKALPKDEPSAPAAPSEPVHRPDTPTALDDPGEFTPKDYSFDVELADGSKIRVSKPEDIDNIPANADFGTPGNLVKMQAGYVRMVQGLEADKREYEASKEAFDKQQAASADLETRLTTMMNEMAYLQTKGKLPEVPAEYDTEEIGRLWNTPEYRDKPGIKERMDLLEYRSKENEERAKVGLPTMSVLEAYTQRQNETYEQKAQETKTRQDNLRKDKGAMVTGASTAPVEDIPDDMIIGEGGSIRDIGL